MRTLAVLLVGRQGGVFLLNEPYSTIKTALSREHVDIQLQAEQLPRRLPVSYIRHQDLLIVIQHSVWLYLHFTLSDRS